MHLLLNKTISILRTINIHLEEEHRVARHEDHIELADRMAWEDHSALEDNLARRSVEVLVDLAGKAEGHIPVDIDLGSVHPDDEDSLDMEADFAVDNRDSVDILDRAADFEEDILQ